MVFSSFVFLFLFLPILTLGYYLIPKRFTEGRNMLLLLFSILFYGWSGPKYLILLAASIGINWGGGVLLHVFRGEGQDRNRKLSLALVVALNCALFGVFKYTDFFISNLNTLFGSEIPLKHIVLPVGISFFTFQGMSYVIDVYRNPKLYLKNPLTVALYITLFPQLVAGPIVRFADVAEDIRARTESLEKMTDGLQRFVFGLAKKIILADTFGMLADKTFGSSGLTTGMAWIGALAYTLQIYFDFSGYSDMAIGLGKLFGFQFCENFNYPYISGSVTEFWRRWHISLSTWFRDYVYIPLGGNRCSRGRQIFNLAVVWSLTGLWHGASWNFVLWGVYYLCWLLLEKYVLNSWLDRIPTVIRRLCTLVIVVFGWVLFRAENLTAATGYLQTMLGLGGARRGGIDFAVNAVNYGAFWLAGAVGATPVLRDAGRKLTAKWGDTVWFTTVRFAIVFLVFLLCVAYIIASSYNAFIYFQF